MRPARALAALALGTVLTACGTEATPGDAAPAVAQRLDQVDAAVARGDLDAARRAVDALVREADRAEEAGDLTPEQADRIDAAAEALLSRLPEAATSTGTTGTETTPAVPTTTAPPEEEPGDDEEAPGNSGHAGEHGHGHGKAKGHDED